jgi:hypothetical protein
MLRWYRALLELRQRLVLRAERTCRAWLQNNSKTLVMQIPKESPELLVVADFESGEEPHRPGWKLILMNDEDGCAVRVYEHEQSRDVAS